MQYTGAVKPAASLHHEPKPASGGPGAVLRYDGTTGVRRWHGTPLVLASDNSLRGLRWPDEAGRKPGLPRERALICRANYHPDGGQLVYPRARYPFVVPPAPP